VRSQTFGAADVSRARDETSADLPLLIAAGAFLVVQLWLGLAGSSFWLDETGTWWMVKDGAAEAVARAYSWGVQSAFFNLVAWLSGRIFGLSEPALRIPSMLAMAGAVFFLFRIAQRLFDRSTAIITSVIFLAAASFYAVDARPYALALFCLTAAVLSLLRWVEKNRFVDAAACVVAGAGVVYAHYLIALGLGPMLLYAVVALWNQRRRLWSVGAMAAGIIALSLPLVPPLLRFYAARGAHTIIGLPENGDLLQAFIPCSMAGMLVILVWLWMSARGRASVQGRCTGPVCVLIASWAVFAPLVLFLLPAVSDLRLFVDGYYSSALPGQALLVGFLISSIRTRGVRTGLVLAIAAAAVLGQSRMSVGSHGGENWRDALHYIRSEAGSAPVLLVSPFAEGADFKALSDPRLREVLFAPEAMYGEPMHAIRLPRTFPYGETARLEEIAGELKDEPRFYFMNDRSDRSYVLWLMGRFGARCRAEAVNRNFGALWIERFDCGRDD
jgi:hypothetical protein